MPTPRKGRRAAAGYFDEIGNQRESVSTRSRTSENINQGLGKDVQNEYPAQIEKARKASQKPKVGNEKLKKDKASKSTNSQGEGIQFGGPWGCAGLMVFSFFITYFMYLSYQMRQGGLVLPFKGESMEGFASEIKDALKLALPTPASVLAYCAFFFAQLLLAAVLPGPTIEGYKVPEEGNRRLKYKCNALGAWWVTIATMMIVTSIWGTAPMEWIADNWGRLLTTAALVANTMAVALFIDGKRRGKATRMSGNLLYDFFMGASLNPRVGVVDLKMFAEIRVSWITVFLLSTAAAVKQHSHGSLTSSMALVWTAHFLYANACMKGEECVPTTFDIFHEKYGWMLIFWNLAGVPFVYGFNAYYALVAAPRIGLGAAVPLVLLLLCGYYVWDTANSQRNHFRMQWNNSFSPRPFALPKLPWSTLKEPKYIKTRHGKPLLISGWGGLARKMHYTGDVVMSLVWGLSCGFRSPMPYFYPLFFTLMIISRERRDRRRCQAQYGSDWHRYEKAVPYTWIPGLL